MTHRKWFFTWLFVIILAFADPLPGFATTTTTKVSYGSNNQSITCTLTSLTNTSKRQCTALDNTSNLFLDVLLFAKIKSGAASTTATGTVNIYVAGTVDGGTTYTDGMTCSDGTATLTVPTNLKLIGVINMVANSTTYTAGPFSVSAAFNGVMPDHWCPVIDNESGGTFDGTTATIFYQGVYTQNL